MSVRLCGTTSGDGCPVTLSNGLTLHNEANANVDLSSIDPSIH